MREYCYLPLDVLRELAAIARATQRADADHWRRELRPRAMRLMAARVRPLAWSRALVSVLLDELHPDDLFDEIVGPPHRLRPAQWPWAVAMALLLRHSWRQADLTRIARRLGLTLSTKTIDHTHRSSAGHHTADFRARLGPVKARRSAPTPLRGADGLDRALGRARRQRLRDGRHRLTPRKGR